MSLSNEPLGDTTTLSLSLRVIREIIRQTKEIRELKTKQGKALLPICRSSSARGPAPNGMEDVTRTSLLMRKLAIFYSPPPVSRPPLMENIANLILPPPFPGQWGGGAIVKFSRRRSLLASLHLVSASGTTMTMTKTLPRLVPM